MNLQVFVGGRSVNVPFCFPVFDGEIMIYVYHIPLNNGTVWHV